MNIDEMNRHEKVADENEQGKNKWKRRTKHSGQIQYNAPLFLWGQNRFPNSVEKLANGSNIHDINKKSKEQWMRKNKNWF